MTQPALHIVTVGTSLIANFTKHHGRQFGSSDDLAKFLAQDPRKRSAELNALIPHIDANKCGSVHLVHSDTNEGKCCAEAIGWFLHSRAIQHTRVGFADPVVSHSAEPFAPLLDAVIRVARDAIQRHQPVIVNATGGFKGQSITAALAARLLNIPAYYIFEQMTESAFLPTVSPTDAQRQQLVKLRDRSQYTDHASLTDDQLDDLECSALVKLQRRADGQVSSVNLTEYAHLLLNL